MRIKFLTILLVSLIGLPLKAQILTVKSEFTSDSVMLGEQLKYRITVEAEKDVLIKLPDYSDTLTKDIDVLRATGIDTSFSDNKRILTKEYTVTSFTPGWNTVRPQPVIFKKGELHDTVYTRSLLLTVLAPVVDTTQAIMPIKPPINTPISFAEILPWALIGLGGLLVILLAIYLYKRYIKKTTDPGNFYKKPLEPAHIIAFRELDKLKEDKLPQKGMVKEYYSRLSEIIRVYITRQFEIPAMESTTVEILDAFTLQNNTKNNLEDLLENLLMLSDLVKFAKEDPLMDENERHLTNAIYFVENTYRLFNLEDKTDESDQAEENQEKKEEVLEEDEILKEEGDHE